MSQRVETYVAHLIAFLLCGAALLGLVWAYKAYVPPCEYESVSVIPDHVHPGQTAIVDRHFRINRPAKIEMSRTMSTVTPTGDILTIQLPGGMADREPGPYKQQRPLTIPHGIPPGEYLLTTHYKSHEWPFFTTHHTAPDVKFTVIPGEAP